jgi:hypothetical protein
MLDKRWRISLMFFCISPLSWFSCTAQVDSDDNEAVQLVETHPSNDGKMASDGVLTLIFSEPPQSVTVNQIPAVVSGKIASWSNPPRLRLRLDLKVREELNAEILSEATRQQFKAQGIPLSQNLCFCGRRIQWLIVDEDGEGIYEVRAEEEWLNVYDMTGLSVGQTMYDIEWTDHRGVAGRDHITLDIEKVDHVPPRIKGSSVKDGDHVVHVRPLIENGILIEFSEPIREGFINFASEDRVLMPWLAEWGEDWVRLEAIKGTGGLTEEPLMYMVDFIVQDLAGNELVEGCRIRFTSNIYF